MARRRKNPLGGFLIVAFLIILVLGGYIAYSMFNKSVVTERDALSQAVKDAKQSRDLSLQDEHLLKLQLAIVDFTAKSENREPPETLDQLVPVYFDDVPVNPETNKPYAYMRDGKMFRLRAIEEQLAGNYSGEDEDNEGQGKSAAEDTIAKLVEEGDFINPNEMAEDTYTYDSTGKRDPFRPFDRRRGSDGKGKTPLEGYSVDQLRLTAVLLNDLGSMTAIVEDSAGKGYTVRIGTRIGNNSGVVVKIEEDKLHILESHVDLTGKEHQKVVHMKLIGKTSAPSSRQDNRRGRNRPRRR